MRKRFYLKIAAGLLFMAGAGAASAMPLVTMPDGVAGDLVINNFRPGATTPGANTGSCGGVATTDICMTFSNLTGSLGGPASLWANNQTTNGSLSLFDPALDLKFFYSPPLSRDVVKLQLSWNDATATFANRTSPFNLLDAAAVGAIINISYTNAGWSLMGLPLTGSGTLGLTVQSANANSIAFSVADGTSGPVTFRQALIGFDNQGSPDNLGIINGSFVIPEPASLSLMAIGLAGLGVARRQKKAA